MANRDDPDESTDFNPYQPTDAALDPATEAEQGAGDRIAASEPPMAPSLGRWLENLPVVFGRILGPVAWGWLLWHQLRAGYRTGRPDDL